MSITMNEIKSVMAAAAAEKGRVSLIGAGPGKRYFTVVCAFMGSTAEDRNDMTSRVMAELDRCGYPYRRVEGYSSTLMVQTWR